jgi:hypothetical protein
VDEAPRAQVHTGLVFALAPQRRADVADPHRLRHPGAPALLQRGPERRLAAAGLAGDEHAGDAGSGQVDVAVGRPLDQVGGVRRRQQRHAGLQQPDRQQQPLAVAGADGDVRDAGQLDRAQRRSGHERARVVGRDNALAGDAGRGVAAGRADHPVLEVGRRQRDVAGRPGGAARGVDADDLVELDAQVCPYRVLLGGGRLQLGLVGERELPDRIQPACVRGVGHPGAAQPGAVERAVGEQVGELEAVRGIVERELLVPRPCLDLGVEHQPGASPPGS